jgi:hypothetical protein
LLATIGSCGEQVGGEERRGGGRGRKNEPKSPATLSVTFVRFDSKIDVPAIISAGFPIVPFPALGTLVLTSPILIDGDSRPIVVGGSLGRFGIWVRPSWTRNILEIWRVGCRVIWLRRSVRHDARVERIQLCEILQIAGSFFHEFVDKGAFGGRGRHAIEPKAVCPRMIRVSVNVFYIRVDSVGMHC